MRLADFISTLGQDVSYGLRLLIKAPGFTAIAVLTLALGIGANTAIFSLIDAVMFRALPVEAPQQLVVLQWGANKDPKYHSYSTYGDAKFSMQRNAANPTGTSFSYPFLEEVEKSNVFGGVAAFAASSPLAMSGNGAATSVSGQSVNGEFFHTLGVRAAAGRLLEPSDDQPSAPPALVLNYGYWQRAFASSSSAIGKVVNLNGVPFTIVGVVERKFISLTLGNVYDVWVPMATMPRLAGPDPRFMRRQNDVTHWWLLIAARLKSGTTAAQGQAILDVLFKNHVLHTPDKPLLEEADAPRITLVPAQEALVGASGQYKDPLRVLMAAVAIVLLIACANVAGLVLSRANARRREIAVRLALGARRLRLLRQLLTESTVLGAMGGTLGIVFAYWGAHAIVSLVAGRRTQPLGFTAVIDGRVLAFTAAISILTGILFGLAPALRSLKIDLTPALKDEPSTSGGGKPRAWRRWLNTRNVLVVIQATLAIVVLMGAGLLVHTLVNLKNLNPGFDTRNTLTFRVDPTLAGYKPAQVDNLYRESRSQITGLPGVVAVSYSQSPLLGGMWMRTSFKHLLPGNSKKAEVDADVMPVGPDFFSTLKIPLLAGRALEGVDFENAAANDAVEAAIRNAKPGTPPPPPPSNPLPVVVNQVFAHKYFTGVNPVGRQFGENDGSDPDDPEKDPGYIIVGIVQDAKYNSLRRAIDPTMYQPLTGRSATFEVRTAGDPKAMVPNIRNLVNQHNSNLPMDSVLTETEQIEQLLQQESLIARLSSFFGLLALVLACVGLYGLLSYEVARRTREIGIRMALGARRPDLIRLVVWRGLVLALIGTAAGIAAAIGVGRLLSSLLYDVKPSDPATMLGVVLLLIVVAILAAFLPARRATIVDPTVALRYE